MSQSEMQGSDLFFRRDRGPVISVRVWDRDSFIRAEVDRGIAHTDSGKPAPYVVQLATVEEFRAERRR